MKSISAVLLAAILSLCALATDAPVYDESAGAAAPGRRNAAVNDCALEHGVVPRISAPRNF